MIQLATANGFGMLAAAGYVSAGAVPDAPTNFAITTSWNIAQCTWTAPAGTVTEYYLQRSAAGAGVWSTVDTITAPATSHNHTMTATDTNYDYRLVAHNTYGDSTASGTITKYTPKVYDAFDGTAATLVQNHAADIPSGTNWTRSYYSGSTTSWELDGSGYAATTASIAAAIFYTQTGLADTCTIKCTIRKTNATDGGQWGMVFRQADAGNFLYIRVDLAANTVGLYRRLSSGTLTLIASVSVTLNTGTDYELRAVLSGTSITWYVDGTSTSSSYASLTANTNVGFLNFSGTANMAVGRFYCGRETT